MTPAASAPPIAAEQPMIDQIVRRAGTLYSLPTVAVEVLELTSNLDVDVTTIKGCIERDPALVAKILRVVNSSLFGLSREVGDLNQALGMLGVKPLKLLVLGFSLPEGLFAHAAADQLAWYWNTTMARAVAAREVSEQLLGQSGDDAFLAGLLQDIGALALLGELREPYARFLGEVAASGADLHRLEVASLGFDHTDLSAALLESWNMPRRMVAAIREPRLIRVLARDREPHFRLARTLHVAELLAQLVGARRLSALSELLEAGEAYFGMDRNRLRDLVGALEPKVQQLHQVLSVEATQDLQYAEILMQAHRQLADVAESAAAPLSLASCDALRGAAAEYLGRCAQGTQHGMPTCHNAHPSLGDAARPTHPFAQPGSTAQPRSSAEPECDLARDLDFARQLSNALGGCRALRQPMSLAMLAVEGVEGGDVAMRTTVSQVLDAALRASDLPATPIVVSPTQRVVMLPGLDRQEGVAMASQWVERVRKVTEQLVTSGRLSECVAGVGVASVALPSRNFPPDALREAACRCLTAALAGIAGGVKSLEIS